MTGRRIEAVHRSGEDVSGVHQGVDRGLEGESWGHMRATKMKGTAKTETNDPRLVAILFYV